ncbi:MAG: flagellar hook-associated protein FlgL [Acetobacteraceae bacterium]|nr:flagellar hook-associated protein FlgL [Acetobacteraceae bacterium]
MRVTAGMLYGNLKRDLELRAAELWESSRVLSTGRRIQLPSDDPVAANRILELRRCLSEAEQHLSNVEDAQGWLKTASVALVSLADDLQRARELAVQGSNPALPQSSRDAIAREVDQLLSHAVQVGNSCFGDRYVFGGTLTGSPPFVLVAPDAVVYQGDAGDQWRELAPGVRLKVNLNGAVAFLPACQALAQVARDLRSGDLASLSGPTLEQVDSALSQVLADQTEVGARENRLDLGKNRLLDLKLNLTQQLSLAEDADMAEALVECARRQAAYQAALAAAGRLLERSLLDFLS